MLPSLFLNLIFSAFPKLSLNRSTDAFPLRVSNVFEPLNIFETLNGCVFETLNRSESVKSFDSVRSFETLNGFESVLEFGKLTQPKSLFHAVDTLNESIVNPFRVSCKLSCICVRCSIVYCICTKYMYVSIRKPVYTNTYSK